MEAIEFDEVFKYFGYDKKNKDKVGTNSYRIDYCTHWFIFYYGNEIQDTSTFLLKNDFAFVHCNISSENLDKLRSIPDYEKYYTINGDTIKIVNIHNMEGLIIFLCVIKNINRDYQDIKREIKFRLFSRFSCYYFNSAKYKAVTIEEQKDKDLAKLREHLETFDKAVYPYSKGFDYLYSRFNMSFDTSPLVRRETQRTIKLTRKGVTLRYYNGKEIFGNLVKVDNDDFTYTFCHYYHENSECCDINFVDKRNGNNSIDYYYDLNNGIIVDRKLSIKYKFNKDFMRILLNELSSVTLLVEYLYNSEDKISLTF